MPEHDVGLMPVDVICITHMWPYNSNGASHTFHKLSIVDVSVMCHYISAGVVIVLLRSRYLGRHATQRLRRRLKDLDHAGKLIGA